MAYPCLMTGNPAENSSALIAERDYFLLEGIEWNAQREAWKSQGTEQECYEGEKRWQKRGPSRAKKAQCWQSAMPRQESLLEKRLGDWSLVIPHLSVSSTHRRVVGRRRHGHSAGRQDPSLRASSQSFCRSAMRNLKRDLHRRQHRQGGQCHNFFPLRVVRVQMRAVRLASGMGDSWLVV